MGRSAPTCPACGREIKWKHSFALWNPWNFPCPHCQVPLEASRIQKAFAFAAIPVGLLLAGIAIYFEKQGLWGTRESLMFFAIVVPILIAGTWASWSYTSFTAKLQPSPPV